MRREWDPSKNKTSKKERIWIYEPNEVYSYGFYKEVMNTNLEYDHRFREKDKETNFEFEYFVLSNWKYVAKVPVKIIEWFQHKNKA